MIVVKMPANSLATSRIGSQSKLFLSRMSAGVTFSETSARMRMMASRKRFCSSTSVP
ncbi:hypothetical protein D3C83_171210 [compost metagenome]